MEKLKANTALYSNARAKEGIEDMEKLLRYCKIFGVPDKVSGVCQSLKTALPLLLTPLAPCLPSRSPLIVAWPEVWIITRVSSTKPCFLASALVASPVVAATTIWSACFVSEEN